MDYRTGLGASIDASVRSVLHKSPPGLPALGYDSVISSATTERIEGTAALLTTQKQPSKYAHISTHKALGL